MNSITVIICPDLQYNQSTIKAVVERFIQGITPICMYIDITYLSNTLVTCSSRIEVNSFESICCRKACHVTKTTTKVNNSKTHDSPSIELRTSSVNSSITSSCTLPTGNLKLPSSIQLYPSSSVSPSTLNAKITNCSRIFRAKTDSNQRNHGLND